MTNRLKGGDHSLQRVRRSSNGHAPLDNAPDSSKYLIQETPKQTLIREPRHEQSTWGGIRSIPLSCFWSRRLDAAIRRDTRKKESHPLILQCRGRDAKGGGREGFKERRGGLLICR